LPQYFIHAHRSEVERYRVRPLDDPSVERHHEPEAPCATPSEFEAHLRTSVAFCEGRGVGLDLAGDRIKTVAIVARVKTC